MNLIFALFVSALSYGNTTDPQAVADPTTREQTATIATTDAEACHGMIPEQRDGRADELSRRAEERRQQRGTSGER